MPKLNPEWIAKTLGTQWSSLPTGDFTSVCTDSRTIQPGTLFVAVKGPTRHGQEFLAQAKHMGALGAIVEEFQEDKTSRPAHTGSRTTDLVPQIVVKDSVAALQKLAHAHRQSFSGHVIGVTGSSGKTSTKELLAHLLGPSTQKTQGNFNNHLGVPLTILAAELTAPAWVIEAGISNFGEMSPLAQIIEPTAGLINMIGTAHLEFFKKKEATAAEKSLILSGIGSQGLIALHARDVLYPSLQTLKAKVLVLVDKENPVTLPKLPANYRALYISMADHANDDGWTLTIDKEIFSLPLWTPGTVRNAALCLALASALGIPAAQLENRLSSWPGVALRGQWMRFTDNPSARIYLDAYNSNPEAMADSLWRFKRLSDEKSPRLYIVGTMGELGDHSDELHRQTAQLIEPRAQDRVILVGAKAGALAEGLKDFFQAERGGHTGTQPPLSSSSSQEGVGGGSVQTLNDLEKIKEILASFKGDCFIKGSHSTNLYTLSSLCQPI